MMNKFVFFIFGILLSVLGYSQDVSFSQVTNNKLYLNPAFTGSNSAPQLTMSYRNQWPALGNQFVTSMVTYEEYFSNINSGFGVLIMNDRSGGSIYSLNSINTYYSNQQQINRKVGVKFGLELSYKQNFVDTDKLFFEDSFNGTSFTNNTSEVFFYDAKTHYFDMGTGVLLFSDKGFVGLSVNHLTEPDQTLSFGGSKLPRKYGLHGSYQFTINETRNKLKSIYYVPSFLLLRQGEFTELTLNNNIRNGKFLGGIGLRLVEGYDYRDALIFNIGVDTKDLMFFYSYDFTISSLGPISGGAHELSVLIKIKERPKKKVHISPPCAF